MHSRAIRHITLTTGHTRDSCRDEIDDEVTTIIGEMIDRIIADDTQTVPIPHVGPYSLGGKASSHCLIATVWADGPPSEVVATIGIAVHSDCGTALWRELHKWGTTPVATDAESCPPAPWVAVALEAAILRHLDTMDWLGDFERCLAHAWMDNRLQVAPFPAETISKSTSFLNASYRNITFPR